MVLLNLAFR